MGKELKLSSFYPAFAAPEGEEVGVKKIADHIEHIADRIGRHQSASPRF